MNERERQGPSRLLMITVAMAIGLVLLFELLEESLFGLASLREEQLTAAREPDLKTITSDRDALSKDLTTLRQGVAQYAEKSGFDAPLLHLPALEDRGLQLKVAVEQINRIRLQSARAKGLAVTAPIRPPRPEAAKPDRFRYELTALALLDEAIRIAADSGLHTLQVNSYGMQKLSRRADRKQRAHVAIDLGGPEPAVRKFLIALAEPGRFIGVQSISIEPDPNRAGQLRIRRLVLTPVHDSAGSEDR